MVRPLVTGIGIFLILLGIQFHCVEEFELASNSSSHEAHSTSPYAPREHGTIVKVKESWPWLAIASGAVLVLYSIAVGAGGKKGH